MRANSLALRLFLSAIAWIAIILAGMGLVLSSLYQDTVERSFDRRLDVYLRTLVSDLASPEDPADKFPQSLGEPMFELPLSGWYWQVTRTDHDKPEVRTSRSLWDAKLPQLDDQNSTQSPTGTRQGYIAGPEDQKLRMLERPIDLGDDGRFTVAVAGDALEIDDEVRSFDRALFLTFAVLSIGLLLTTMFQVRFGLAPLARISQSLKAIRSGSAERLEGEFPVEIAPLARETNALIDSNREIVDRARTHVGNLAHALKTPLSVMLTEAHQRPGPLAEVVSHQSELMRGQVDHHLRRARAAARAQAAGERTAVEPVLDELASTIERVCMPKAVTIDWRCPEDLCFRGERQDLLELAGNVIENAGKWCKGKVRVTAAPTAPERFSLTVEDDGPGLPPEQRDEVLKRGARLDESAPGSGLGLAIVDELARAYGGSLALGDSAMGGLKVELMLPRAES